MSAKSPLKIIIFDGSLNTTTFINRLAVGLSKHHKVYILGFNGTLKTKIPNIQYVNLGNVQHFIPLVFRSKLFALKVLFKTGNIVPLFKTIKSIFTLNKKGLQQQNFNMALNLIKPSVLHVQWPSLLSWCHEAATRKSLKIVLSQRGYQSNVRPFLDKNNFEYLEKWFANIDGFHSVSKAISKKGDKIFNDTSKIDKVIYSGFDFELLPFSPSYKKNEIVQLISVGRPHWKKGYSYMLQACKKLKDQNIRFHYEIIGGSGNEELLYLIKEFELTSCVTLRGKVSQNEVYQKIQGSDIFVLPSLEEGIANVVIEAMALGTPVITSNCGGMEELVRHQKTGWLVPTRNAELLANEIMNVNLLPIERIDEVRKLAREKVEQQHAIQTSINDMETLYYQVIES